MKILSVSQRTMGDQIVLSARCKIRRVGLDDVTFKIPSKFESFILADASPFAAALLLPSMKLGEDLIIEGAISERLHSGMQELIRIVSGWNIGLKPINIEARELVPDAVESGATGTFFSGGVDSFYTYLRHQDDPKDRVTHLILVRGYDIGPSNTELWEATLRNIREIASEEQATLVEVESNVRRLIDPIVPWSYTFGGCLAAVALCLRRGLGRVYIPGSHGAADQRPWGSTLFTDHLWSTETLDIVHDGTEANRLDKVDWQIARSPLALRHLRVCYKNKGGTYNCGECEKCLRTMVELYVVGALDRAETFPHKIEPDRLAELSIRDKYGAVFHWETLAALEARDLAPDLQAALKVSLAQVVADPKPAARHRVFRTIEYLDHSYARGTAREVARRITGRRY
jgi:hypothetical protein